MENQGLDYIYKNMNSLELNELGKLTVLLLDPLYKKYINVKNIEDDITKLVMNKNYLLSDTNKVGNNIFMLISFSNEFKFLNQNEELKNIILNDKEIILHLLLKNDNYFYNNGDLIKNSSLSNLIKNKKFEFLDLIAPIINTDNINKEDYLNIIKTSLNYGYTNFIKVANQKDKKLIQDYRSPYNNISKHCNTLDSLEKLKEYLNLEPNSIEEWYQDKAFNISREIKNGMLPHMSDQVDEFLNLTLECKNKGFNIEFSNSKDLPPPLWYFLFNCKNKSMMLYENDCFNPSTIDNKGRNLPNFLLELNKKYAPKESDLEIYNQFLEKMIKDGKFDFNLQNKEGLSAIDQIKQAINKKTKFQSSTLDKYKVIAERLLLISNTYGEDTINLNNIKRNNKL